MPRVMLLCLVALLLGGGALVGCGAGEESGETPGRESTGTDSETCNGDPDLCDRPLNEVAFAASHNAMAAADGGYINPFHWEGIREQLEFGIRGFLIDTYYGVEDEDGDVDTAPVSLDSDEFDDDTEQVDVEDIDTYLCHGLCELGATRLVPALTGLREWLEQNAREVLILVIEDRISPEDTRAAFEASGLDELVWRSRLELGDRLPTLGEMIESNQRVLVMAENDTGGIPWYQPAFELMQETPFRLLSAEEMSCEPGRGRTDSPLFQINHWIASFPPSPENAEIVNDRDFMLDRVRRCEEERGLRATLVAVDFYDEGDVLGAVASLNDERMTRASG